MAYDRLADAIIKHPKPIVVAWILVFVLALFPAVQAFGNMSYDVTDMGIDNSESMEGFGVIGEYFPSSDTDISSTPLLVMKYDNKEERNGIEGLVVKLNESIPAGAFDDVAEDGTSIEKIREFLLAMDTSMTNPKEDGSGIAMVAVVYNPAWTGSVSTDTADLRDAIHETIDDDALEYGIDIYLTGSPAIMYDMETGAMEDISHIDVFTIGMVIILAGLFFRSFVTSVTPPLTIFFAFLISMGLIWLLMFVMDIYFITEMMLIVSMFGAGCDYCIFILARYREELRDGKEHEEALRSSIKWAGESISISGLSVMIGFGTMSICSFSMVSTMGLSLAIGILVALLAALTFIPSILAIVGDKIFWPTKTDAFKEGGKATKGWYAWSGRVGHAYFEKSSHFTLKHAKAITLVAVLISVPAAYVALSSETSYDMTSSMMTGESGDGMDYIGEYADEGLIYPNYAIIEYDGPIAQVGINDGHGYLIWDTAWLQNTYPILSSEVKQPLMEEGNITTVSLPMIWQSEVMAQFATGVTNPQTIVENIIGMSGTSGQYISAYHAAVTSNLVDSGMDQMTASATAFGAMVADQDMDGIIDQAPAIDYVVNVTGGIVGGDYVKTGAGTVNYIKISASTHDAAMSQRSMDSISYMQGVVRDYASADPAAVATWITGSAVVMFDVSQIISGEFTHIEILVVVLIIILLFFVMKSYTIPFRSVLTILMSICWTLAATHLIFGDEVTWLIPLILLVICLGLGMDYDILLTTRIKENVKANGMTTDEAIHNAVMSSGSVITICGLIMGGAFGTLMLSSMGMLQQFGFALCFAIICDALIVRTYIVPAVMHLLGDWNWKGPKFLMSKAEKAALEHKD